MKSAINMNLGLGIAWIFGVIMAPWTYGQNNSVDTQLLKKYEQQLTEIQGQIKELRSDVSRINRGVTHYGQSDRLGFVNIYTDCDAEVYIGGQFVGNAPINQGLVPGTYSVEIVDPLTGYRESKVVEIRTGATVTIDKQLHRSPYLTR